MDVDSELDRLYSLPLDEFTSERNSIAKAAKDDGDDDAAKRVKSLKKPSVGAWTLNQLAREYSEEIGELLSIRDDLERADSSQELRELARRRRDLVAKLAKMARLILEGSEHGASHATVEKVSQGLLAGGDDEDRESLRKGRSRSKRSERSRSCSGRRNSYSRRRLGSHRKPRSRKNKRGVLETRQIGQRPLPTERAKKPIGRLEKRASRDPSRCGAGRDGTGRGRSGSERLPSLF